MLVNKLFTTWGSQGDYTYYLLAGFPQQVKAEVTRPSFLRLPFLRLGLEMVPCCFCYLPLLKQVTGLIDIQGNGNG